MRINIELSEKSIQAGIRQLKQVEKTLKTIFKEFLEDVCLWVIEKANWYLENADLGELVKLQIQNGWEYEITSTNAKIINRTEKAVFVEFGVGVVGQTQKHPNSDAEGYEYNKQSNSKAVDGSWIFFTNENELDLPKSSLLAHNWYNDLRGKGGESGKRLLIMTKGAKGVWYAYNAIVDAHNELKNPNGELSTKWKKLLERYLG